VAVASSRDAGEKNVLAMVMGPDSEDETPGEFIDQPPMGTSPTFDTVPGTTSLVMSHGGSNAAADDNARSKRKTQSLSVPDSFFDSATLAAAARGEKVVRLTPEETLASFEQSIEADIEEAKRQEQLEIENESVAKKELEAFQQKERVVGVSRLKEKAAAARRTGATRIATEKYPGTGHKKPTRPVDKNAGNNASVSTDSDSEDDDGLVMDWRAKKT
jgi:acetylornithine deacetylase/succinyl-diaminopimelate desuccinylase-like protein